MLDFLDLGFKEFLILVLGDFGFCNLRLGYEGFREFGILGYMELLNYRFRDLEIDGFRDWDLGS